MKIKLKLKIPKIIIFGIDVIKNMLFFTSFVIIFLFLLGVIVAPSIRKFKETKNNYYITQTKYNETQSKLNQASIQYQKLYNKNHRIILALQQKFNKNNFINFSKKFLKISDIKDQNISVYQKQFLKKTYVVSASLKSPEQFYKFINNTKNYQNILKIYFPVVFKTKNGDIKVLFKLEEFKVK